MEAEHFVKANGQTLAVYHHPNEGKPKLLFLHGFGGCFSAFERLVRSLNSDFDIFGMDFPGHGRSHSWQGSNRPNLNELASLVGVVISELHIQNPLIHGYSLGGRVALKLAQTENKLAALILESVRVLPLSSESAQNRLETDQKRVSQIKKSKEQFFSSWNRMPLFTNDSSNYYLPFQKMADRASLAEMIEAASPGRIENALPSPSQLQMPLFFFYGKEDPKLPEYISKHASTALTTRLDVIPNSRHRIHLDNPAYLSHRIKNYLQAK